MYNPHIGKQIFATRNSKQAEARNCKWQAKLSKWANINKLYQTLMRLKITYCDISLVPPVCKYVHSCESHEYLMTPTQMWDCPAQLLQAADTVCDTNPVHALSREGVHKQVPLGGEEMATVLKLVGRRPSFSFQVKDHLALGEALDVIDFETGAKASGTKFVYLKCAIILLGKCQWTMTRSYARG